jgi:hypothetical protein
MGRTSMRRIRRASPQFMKNGHEEVVRLLSQHVLGGKNVTSTGLQHLGRRQSNSRRLRDLNASFFY